MHEGLLTTRTEENVSNVRKKRNVSKVRKSIIDLKVIPKSDRSENIAIQLARVDLVISATILQHPNARTSKKK